MGKRRIAIVIVVAASLAGCGGDSGDDEAQDTTTASTAADETTTEAPTTTEATTTTAAPTTGAPPTTTEPVPAQPPDCPAFQAMDDAGRTLIEAIEEEDDLDVIQAAVVEYVPAFIAAIDDAAALTEDPQVAEDLAAYRAQWEALLVTAERATDGAQFQDGRSTIPVDEAVEDRLAAYAADFCGIFVA